MRENQRRSEVGLIHNLRKSGLVRGRTNIYWDQTMAGRMLDDFFIVFFKI